jgi:hypothetical protein
LRSKLSITAFSRLQIADFISRIASRRWLILHLGGQGMRRRELVRGIAGSAIFWPLNVLAQQRSSARRVAVLMGTAQSARDEGYVSTLFLRLAELGWRAGVNL